MMAKPGFCCLRGFSISIFQSKVFTGMACSHCWALPFFSSWIYKSDRFTDFGYFKRAFSTDFSIFLNRFPILMVSIWSWKLILIYRFWFPISKTNLSNWTKTLISSLQFDSAEFQFSGWSPIQVDRFNLLIFNLQQFNLIHEDSIQFDQILIRWKVQISWSSPLFNSTIYPNSWFSVLRP
jgi:hypothetical protein